MLSSAVFVGAQEGQKPTPTPQSIDTKAVNEKKNTDAVYGKIKEVTNGQKIVIAIDNRLDKTYNLGDAKKVVRVAEGLAVGDSVKVLETDVKGNPTVDIVRNVDAAGTNDQQRARAAEDKR